MLDKSIASVGQLIGGDLDFAYWGFSRFKPRGKSGKNGFFLGCL